VYEFLDYRVQDFMSPPVTIPPEALLADAERILEEKRFNALPVVDENGALIGLVTSLDFLKAFSFSADSMFPPYDQIMRRSVGEIMSLNPLGVQPLTPLTRILQKMIDTRNKSFPVVDGARVVGVVTREDVMRALRMADAGRHAIEGLAPPVQ
jgi:CBS domain-containing protein